MIKWEVKCRLESQKDFCNSVINKAICCFWCVSHSVFRDTSLGWIPFCFSVSYWFGAGCIRADYFHLFGSGVLLYMTCQFFWNKIAQEVDPGDLITRHWGSLVILLYPFLHWVILLMILSCCCNLQSVFVWKINLGMQCKNKPAKALAHYTIFQDCNHVWVKECPRFLFLDPLVVSDTCFVILYFYNFINKIAYIYVICNNHYKFAQFLCRSFFIRFFLSHFMYSFSMNQNFLKYSCTST